MDGRKNAMIFALYSCEGKEGGEEPLASPWGRGTGPGELRAKKPRPPPGSKESRPSPADGPLSATIPVSCFPVACGPGPKGHLLLFILPCVPAPPSGSPSGAAAALWQVETLEEGQARPETGILGVPDSPRL